jgi:hypothetical protein
MRTLRISLYSSSVEEISRTTAEESDAEALDRPLQHRLGVLNHTLCR